MSELLWRFGFIIAVGALVWVLHQYVGAYPDALPKSTHTGKDIRAALFLWGVAIIFPLLMAAWVSPRLDRMTTSQTLNQLMQVPLRSIPYLLLPVILVTRPRGWTTSDLGLSRKNESLDATIFAILVGIGSGSIAYLTGQSNISVQVLSGGALFLLIYNNAFLEEFFHRGVIQSLLERSIGQGKAILWGGVLFGLTHLAFDVSALMETNGIWAVFSALLLQTEAGWLFGIVFMKTRSLWPGIACHYLANWLPSILAGVAG